MSNFVYFLTLLVRLNILGVGAWDLKLDDPPDIMEQHWSLEPHCLGYHVLLLDICKVKLHFISLAKHLLTPVTVVSFV